MSAEIISFKPAPSKPPHPDAGQAERRCASASDAFLSFLIQMRGMAIEAWIESRGGDSVLARVADPAGHRLLILVSELAHEPPEEGPEYA